MIVESSGLSLWIPRAIHVIFYRCRNTCDLSPVSWLDHYALPRVRAHWPLRETALPRVAACQESSGNAQARGVGKFAPLKAHSTILFLNRGFAGAQAAGALLP